MSPRYQTDDLRIKTTNELISPDELIKLYPITDEISGLVYDTRDSIRRILREEDNRILVVVGPCSVHDPDAAREYAHNLRLMIDQLQEQLLIVMRVYFEKPRTTVGWKGLINDPTLDGRFEINSGLKQARSLLVDINTLGVPAGSEFLD
ncbi:phospho-2-dehydro-3-deoxyheptonate aldolase, partial [Achromatium sp. WMS2]